MIRKVFLLCVVVLVCESVSGQFKNKDWYISPKISFADYSDRNDWDGYSIKKIPPVSVALEKGVTDFLSVGAMLGYNRNKYVNDTLSTNTYRYSNMVFGGLASVHFAGWIEEWTNYSVFLGDWDFYAGLGVLCKWKNKKETDVWNTDLNAFEQNTNRSFEVKMKPIVGVRYFVTDNFCMLVEVGHGNIGLVTTGITFRLPHHEY